MPAGGYAHRLPTTHSHPPARSPQAETHFPGVAARYAHRHTSEETRRRDPWAQFLPMAGTRDGRRHLPREMLCLHADWSGTRRCCCWWALPPRRARPRPRLAGRTPSHRGWASPGVRHAEGRDAPAPVTRLVLAVARSRTPPAPVSRDNKTSLLH